MFGLGESIKDDTRLQLVGEEDKRRTKRRFFGLFKQRKDADEKRIFRKEFNPAEFVGEELCNIRHLRCARPFLIGEAPYRITGMAQYVDLEGKGFEIKIGTYDFRDQEKYDYFQIVDNHLYNEENYLDTLLLFAPTDKNRRELLDEAEEMFALDTFMGQTDRFWNNVMFERDKETKEIHLAPLYDFEYSLNPSILSSKKIYENVLHNFRTEEDYVEFIKEHPEFADKLKFYLDVDLVEVIERCFRAKGMKVPDRVIPFYESFQEDRKDFIRRVTGEQKRIEK